MKKYDITKGAFCPNCGHHSHIVGKYSEAHYNCHNCGIAFRAQVIGNTPKGGQYMACPGVRR